MKKPLRFLALFIALCALAGAASAPAWVATLVRIQTDPTSGIAQAYFERTVAVGACYSTVFRCTGVSAVGRTGVSVPVEVAICTYPGSSP